MSTTGGDERDDIDAQFADIIARWDDPPQEALDPPAPTSEERSVDRSDSDADARAERSAPDDAPDTPETPETPEISAPPPDRADPVDRGAPNTLSASSQLGEPVPFRRHEMPEDDEEKGYEPPPPRPLPAFFDDWPFYLALVGLVGGPLWLVYLALFDSTERSLMWAAGGLTLAGFATLVLRQPKDRDIDDDDDGARV
ncbi:hypothetical protein [Mobilicoccus caccae]|uniref:Uncharacterized protein n=1 Tax=Mobilicoccus caccae TaxID=1859295 RepID=A0ABQ6ISZ3_9MICO|nr:hypothetical protein [Mobilicoccus caccae]GMA39813.1 hypothetical protein GCM10025883_18580 [Mobilicoccus caccae]